MAFVKLDTGILDSTLWIERECREVFITALLMAEPFELETPAEQLEVRTLEKTGFIVPVGWYGFVRAAGPGIVRRALVDQESGLIALERLCAPDEGSRSADFEGRRLARVDGGYIVLNFMKYRDRDNTAAERMKRYRERNKLRRNSDGATPSQLLAEAEAEAEKTSKGDGRAVALPDWLPQDAWEAWLEVRKKSRTPNTQRALRLAITELAKLKASGQNVRAVLEQSTLRGWRGVFEVKSAQSQQPQKVDL